MALFKLDYDYENKDIDKTMRIFNKWYWKNWQ